MKKLKNYALSQFSADDFCGYRVQMEQEHDYESRKYLIRSLFLGDTMICGGMFLVIKKINEVFLHFIIYSYIIVALLLLMLIIFRISKKIWVQYIILGTLLFFVGLFIFFICKVSLFYDESFEDAFSSNVYALLNIVFYTILIFIPIVGYFVYYFCIKYGMYTSDSKRTKERKEAYKKMGGTNPYHRFYTGLGLLCSSFGIPAFIIGSKDGLMAVIGIFTGYLIIFTSCFFFIAAYFLKRYPILTTDLDDKLTSKDSK